MKKIEAIIRLDRLEDLKDALSRVGFTRGMTVSQVPGYGSQRGSAEYVHGQKIMPTSLVKIRVGIVVHDVVVDEIVGIICKAVRTGEIGDGKISILPIEEVICIRTGE